MKDKIFKSKDGRVYVGREKESFYIGGPYHWDSAQLNQLTRIDAEFIIKHLQMCIGKRKTQTPSKGQSE